MEDEKIKSLLSILESLDNKSSLDKVVKSFEIVVEFAKQTREMTETEIENLRVMFNEAINEARNNNSEQFAILKARVLSTLEEKSKDIKEKNAKQIIKLETRVQLLEEEERLDKDEIINETLSKIPPQEKLEPETPETLKKKILPITIEDVAQLRQELDELKARPIGRGGGTSAIGVAQAFKYIAHTEAPVGDIDGVNTTYRVKNTIFWVAGFTLNGEQIAQIPNFTVSGRTITFSSALPSAYSGKDFEIKYIGT